MLDNIDDYYRWLGVFSMPDHPYLDHISKLRKKGQMMDLREMKEALWNAECDLIAVDDNEDSDDIRDHLDTARERLRVVRRDLTLLLGDVPDNLLEEYWNALEKMLAQQ